MGDMLTNIKAFIVKELCVDRILGMDFINKYKLIINTEDRTVSIRDSHKHTTLQFDVNKHCINYPARLIKHIQIPPKRTVLNSSLNIHRHTSFISLHNPTNEGRLLPKDIILGTTTIPTLSFKKDRNIDYSLAQKHICNSIQSITNLEQKDKVKRVLDKHVKLFDTTKPTIVANVKPHAIKTLDYPPPSSKPYYSTPAKQDAMYKITQELLQ
ncbi:unnamed protein product, partial [Rotaria magnacalcarata]